MRKCLSLIALLFSVCTGTVAQAADLSPLRIGLIADLTKLSAFSTPSINGVKMAIDEANAMGGIQGRKVDLIVRDDRGDPASAQDVVTYMDQAEKVDALLVHSWSHIAKSLSGYAGHNHIPLLAFWMTINDATWDNYNPYGFSIDDTPLVQARALVGRVQKLPYKRWYIAGPDVGYARSISESFKEELKKQRPDVEFVGEIYTPAMKLDANTVVGAILAKQPDAVFSPYFGSDLSQYVRIGRKRGLFDTTFHVNPMAGFPESMGGIRAEFPPNWLVIGYPGSALRTPEYLAFVDQYKTKYHTHPQWAGTVGYIYAKMLLQAMHDAPNLTHDSVAEQLPKTAIDSPFGHITMRHIDNRSDMGGWIGIADFSANDFKLRDFEHYDVNKLSPPDAWIQKKRGQP